MEESKNRAPLFSDLVFEDECESGILLLILRRVVYKVRVDIREKIKDQNSKLTTQTSN